MRRLSLLLVAATVGALLLFSVAAQAAVAERAKLSLLDRSQPNAAQRGYVRVVVRGTRAARYRVVVGLSRTGVRVPVARATVRRADARRWVLRVKLHPQALRRLRECGAWRLDVTLARGTRRVGTARTLLRGARTCVTPARAGTGANPIAAVSALAASSTAAVVAAPRGQAPAASPESNDAKQPAPAPDDKPKPKPDPDPEPEPEPVAPGFDTSTIDRCDPTDPAVCLQPFPNNHFTAADDSTPTKRRVNLQRDSMPKNRLGKPIEPADYNWSDGFPAGTSIVTRVPGLDNADAFRNTGAAPIDDPARSLEEDAPVQVIDAETGKPHLVWAEIDSNPADAADRNLIIRPAVHFREGARYIVVLRKLRDKDGKELEANRAFQVFRDRIVTTDAKVEERRGELERDVFAPLAEAGINRKHLYNAWDFTVASAESTTGRMLSIRNRAFAELGDENLADRQIPEDSTSPTFTLNPDIPDDATEPIPAEIREPFENESPVTPEKVDGVRDFAEGPIARRVRGKIVVPCYLNAPGCPPGAQFQLGDNGLPIQLPQNKAVYDFACNIPRPKPGEPANKKFRPLLYGHGLLGEHEEINWGGNPDFAYEYGFIYCAVDWNGMAFKDLPNVATILQDVSRFPTMSDGLQQGFLGFLYLGRALLHPEGMPAHDAFQEKIDTTELFYDGNSQGGIYGGSLLAIAPDHERAVLGVPGMNYSTLLHRSVDFDGYANGEFVDGFDSEFGMYDSYPNELERPLLFALVQMIWDRSDPSGYAAHMTDDPLPNTPAHKALLQVGFGDFQVADITTEVEARTIGAHVRRPLIPDDRPRYRDRPYPDAPAPEVFQGVPSLADGHDGSGVVFFSFPDPARTPPPLATNIAPREDKANDKDDPHENVRRDPQAQRQKSEFLKPDGRFVNTCGAGPCLMK